MTRPVALSLFAVLATGCTELEPFLPTVSFERLDVQEISFERIDTNFVFAIDNPNPISIGLSSFSYDLALEDVDLLAGDNEDGFQLEADGSSDLALPVGLTWQGVFDTISATRGEDYVGFGLKGHFGFETGTSFGEARVPYDEAGDFPALRTPKFAFKRVRVSRVDLLTQEADIDIVLGVDNDQGSTLFFDNFDYGVEFNGTSVATGIVRELTDVEGGTEGTTTIPITVDLLSVGTSIVTAIVNKDRIHVGLDATVDVDTPFGVVPLDVVEAADMLLQ